MSRNFVGRTKRERVEDEVEDEEEEEEEVDKSVERRKNRTREREKRVVEHDQVEEKERTKRGGGPLEGYERGSLGGR